MNNILIYDDCYEHANELKELLYSVLRSKAAVIDVAVKYDEASKLIKEKNYSVFFVDIELDDNNSGISIGEVIQKRFPKASLVYITAYIKYCEEIFLTSPDAFMLKPFSKAVVKRTLGIIEKKKQSPDHISIATSKNAVETISLERIMYIENVARNVYFYDVSSETVYKYYGLKLSQVADKLPKHFVRCHQSFCVNMRMVKSIERYCFIMNNGREIPISQSRFVETRQRYLDFLGDTL